jgi:hypothetical protein
MRAARRRGYLRGVSACVSVPPMHKKHDTPTVFTSTVWFGIPTRCFSGAPVHIQLAPRRCEAVAASGGGELPAGSRKQGPGRRCRIKRVQFVVCACKRRKESGGRQFGASVASMAGHRGLVRPGRACVVTWRHVSEGGAHRQLGGSRAHSR